MPLTFYSNGISTATASKTSAGKTIGQNSAAGDNDCDISGNLYVAGASSSISSMTVNNTFTVASTGRFTIGTGTGVTIIGERIYIPFSFTSAAVTTYQVIPAAGNIIDCWITCDTTPRTCSAFTLYANGTAGTVCVASVALAYATAIGQQIQPALTPAIQGTGTALAFVITTAGSAASFSGVVVIQRTS